jgi:hypothetical protein
LDNKTSPERLTGAQRRQRVVERRCQGATLQAIGGELCISRQRVHVILTEEIAQFRAGTQADLADLVELESQRLDALQAGLWDKALAGDVKAARTVVKIMERRARLLGLDAPTRVQRDQFGLAEKSGPELLAEADRVGLNLSPEARALLEEGEKPVQAPAASLTNGNSS